jgi:hypothetical protein
MEQSNWGEQHIATLAPPDQWTPDASAALRRHHARRQQEWRRGPGYWWKLAIAAGLLLALAAAPPTRALAQRLWAFLTVARVEVVQLDLDALPKRSSLRAKQLHAPTAVEVASPEEARMHIGFLPKLPPPTVLQGTPKLTLLGPADYEIRIKLEDIRELLQNAGVTGEALPADWDGARIVLHSAGTVMAEWPGSDTMLIQAPPLQIAMPEGFDLRRFTTLMLRGLKLPADQAERLGARMATAPAWMLALDAEDKVGMREVKLRSGPGTLVYDYDTDHPDRIERLTLIWSTSDRINIISCGCGDAVAIAAANAMD